MATNPYPPVGNHTSIFDEISETRDLREKVAELRGKVTELGAENDALSAENGSLRQRVEQLEMAQMHSVDRRELQPLEQDWTKLHMEKLTMLQKIEFLDANLQGAQEHNRSLPKEQQCHEMWTRAEWKPIEHVMSPEQAEKFREVGQNGSVYSYQHSETHRYLHVDSHTGQCYDRDKHPIDREQAVSNALAPGPANVRALPEERKEQGVGMQMAM